MQKLIHLITFAVVFLFITQIAQGQRSSIITQSTGKTCIPNTLLDSMIHDIQVGKVLKAKDSLSIAYISSLERSNSIINTKYQEAQISILKSEKKRIRNGWQRNILLVMSVLFGVLAVK